VPVFESDVGKDLEVEPVAEKYYKLKFKQQGQILVNFSSSHIVVQSRLSKMLTLQTCTFNRTCTTCHVIGRVSRLVAYLKQIVTASVLPSVIVALTRLAPPLVPNSVGSKVFLKTVMVLLLAWCLKAVKKSAASTLLRYHSH
jgi:hypothetical protein